jgi:hypothetical protein
MVGQIDGMRCIPTFEVVNDPIHLIGSISITHCLDFFNG